MEVVSNRKYLYATVCYWNGHNLNHFKHVFHFYANDSDTEYVITPSHALKLSETDYGSPKLSAFTDPQKVDLIAPAGSFIVRYDDADLTFAHHTKAYMQKNFSKPNVHRIEIVSNKTGKHYHAFKWTGHWNSLPDNLPRDDGNADDGDTCSYTKDAQNVFHFSKHDSKKLSNITVPVNGYFLLSTDDNVIFGTKGISKQEFQSDYHVAHSVKLPSYLFVVVQDSGMYSDSDQQVLNICSTAKQANRLADHYEHEDGSDYHMDSPVDYIVYQIPTHK